MGKVAGWWDGFELWVAGLPFIPQFLVALVTMVPVSVVIARILDRGLCGARLVLGQLWAAAASDNGLGSDPDPDPKANL